MMDELVAPFVQLMRGFELKEPTLPYVSNLTGKWITKEDAMDPDYWGRHLRHTVNFSAGVQLLMESEEYVFLEVGPGRDLASLVQAQGGGRQGPVVLSSLGRPGGPDSDIEHVVQSLGRLWLTGAKVSWSDYYAKEERRRVALPTYPFERQRYWIDRRPQSGPTTVIGDGQNNEVAAPGASPISLHERSGLADTYVAPRNKIEQVVAEIWSEL